MSDIVSKAEDEITALRNRIDYEVAECVAECSDAAFDLDTAALSGAITRLRKIRALVESLDTAVHNLGGAITDYKGKGDE